MRLRWLPSTTLSWVRMVQHASEDSAWAESTVAVALRPIGIRVSRRVASCSVAVPVFWESLTEELVSARRSVPMTPELCEVALLRAGGSQFQSDQVASAVFRELEAARRAVMAQSPRIEDQLRLRYGPLKQAYETYGPGLMQWVGRKIWNGPPPADWWPSEISVHAVTPVQQGASGISPTDDACWVEAVLTDVDPRVPEWLRLSYQIVRLAVASHTRTHASGGTSRDGGGAERPSQLPWSFASLVWVLAAAEEMGVLSEPLPISTALHLWVGIDGEPTEERGDPAEGSDTATDGSGGQPQSVATRLSRWWRETGRHSQATPLALRQLASELSRPVGKV